MSGLTSVFASLIDAMLDYREALGYSRATHSANLQAFDRYCAERGTDKAALSKSLVWEYMDALNAKKRSGMREKAATLRLFGKYLCAIGKTAYIMPDEMFAPAKTEPPYIFTNLELGALFRAIDAFPESNSDHVAKIFPTLFRLIYTCGLRPNEGRELFTQNINFDTGEILITKTKRHKERIVVMSDDMLDFCETYSNASAGYRKNTDYFFPTQDGDLITGVRMNGIFNECWRAARPGIEDLPGIRVYDLRHRFASAALIRWIDEGRDLYAMLPYLSAYMGHDSLTETAYYIHVLPENLVKSSGIDWAAFDDILPEVTGI
jgi:integrase